MARPVGYVLCGVCCGRWVVDRGVGWFVVSSLLVADVFVHRVGWLVGGLVYSLGGWLVGWVGIRWLIG